MSTFAHINRQILMLFILSPSISASVTPLPQTDDAESLAESDVTDGCINPIMDCIGFKHQIGMELLHQAFAAKYFLLRSCFYCVAWTKTVPVLLAVLEIASQPVSTILVLSY